MQKGYYKHMMWAPRVAKPIHHKIIQMPIAAMLHLYVWICNWKCYVFVNKFELQLKGVAKIEITAKNKNLTMVRQAKAKY